MSDMSTLSPDQLTALQSVLTHAHYSRMRFYWMNRGHASNQGTAVDLELFKMGLIAPGFSGHDRYKVTDAAVELLAAKSESDKARRAPHHELGARTAQWLREKGRITWEGVEFRVRELDVAKSAKAMDIDVSRAQGILYASPRPDVYSVMATMTEARIEPWVHEVKVSRADFLSDVAKPFKRLAYAQIAERVFYVTPAGLVKPDEVPELCGLIYEHAPGEFEVARRAKKKAVKLDASHFMNMVVKRGEMPGSLL